jgi:predicted Rossmann-fold nucleotide-binding protein
VLTWRQLGLHQKPVILLNTNGYWDPLTALLDHVVARGFAEESLLGYVDTVDDVDGALDVLRRSLTA